MLTLPSLLTSVKYSLKDKWFEITRNASNNTTGNSLCKLREENQAVEESAETTAYSHCSAHGRNKVHHICKKWGEEEEMESRKPSYVLHHRSYKVFLTAVQSVRWINFCQNHFWDPKILHGSCPTVLWEQGWTWALGYKVLLCLNSECWLACIWFPACFSLSPHWHLLDREEILTANWVFTAERGLVFHFSSYFLLIFRLSLAHNIHDSFIAIMLVRPTLWAISVFSVSFKKYKYFEVCFFFPASWAAKPLLQALEAENCEICLTERWTRPHLFSFILKYAWWKRQNLN